uniref:Uncharacterized protein n=1 Tax=Tanacetum cinerariifolium TaxID=118510 RepID=A0A6L2KJG6_TANCI|nr:hypothetical protein [Tanacetum cinerariifolium]
MSNPASPDHITASPDHLPASYDHIPKLPERVPASPDHVFAFPDDAQDLEMDIDEEDLKKDYEMGFEDEEEEPPTSLSDAPLLIDPIILPDYRTTTSVSTPQEDVHAETTVKARLDDHNEMI